ncbi:M16 family metallopeptidase [Streptomyces sp. NBC_01294]|uniref:M16 family metallopeptidase n=1 Tax=Streptomyces sp. NBC_01294 TaxID=2903815 RepID=UPI002DDA057D|nr:pitrilysin family protein [Streptomyces sp. NBC_01294]WRZ58121.1 insulinase family protein [Streptomyces sp. NBC_01294]
MSPYAGRLPNGLRLSVEPLPGHGSGLVSVALTVAVGGDDDPAGQHGMAHLVEHLMFPRMGGDDGLDSHVARVEGAGGVCNAETHRDHTVFHTTVPAGMLPDVLEWEARRLLTFAPEEAVLRTETGVIAEEIRGAAAGGRFWETALEALHPGSRDSFGTPEELAGITAADATAFFRRHYRADALVLSVTGDVDADRVAASVDSLFAPLPAGTAPADDPVAAPHPAPVPVPASASASASASTPASTPAPIRTAPLPSPVSGVALGYPLPDPVSHRHAYLAQVVLAEALGRHRLPQLTRRDSRLTSARITCGYHGQWLASAAPDLALVLLARAPGVSAEEAVDSWLEVLRDAAERPAGADEHQRAVNALLLACHRTADSLTARSVTQGRTALLFPGSGGLAALPGDLARVTPDDVSAAARVLLSGPCSVTELGENR